MNKYISILTFLFLSGNALAFTLSTQPPSKFSKNEIIVNVAASNCAQSVTAGELLNLVEKAFDEHWNRVATCALKLTRGTVMSGVDVSNDDLTTAVGKATAGTILIGCSDQVTGSTLGVGGNTGIDTGAVLINDSNTNFANLSESDKVATIAHEIGHAFGLGHSSDPVALMYYAVGGTIREKLTLDDYDGCTYLYPHDSPGSCNSVNLISGDNSKPSGGVGFFKFFLVGLVLASIFGKFLNSSKR